MQAPDLGYHTATFATHSSGAGGAVCWIVDQVVRHGPSWAIVPPLMFGAASLAGAVMSWRKMGQDLDLARDKAAREQRQSEEPHQARLKVIQLTGRDPIPFVPEVNPCQ